MRPILTVTVNPTIDIGMAVGALDPAGKNRATVRGVTAGGGGINVARAVVELGGAAAVHTAGVGGGRAALAATTWRRRPVAAGGPRLDRRPGDGVQGRRGMKASVDHGGVL